MKRDFSDFHKPVFTVLDMFYAKQKQRIVKYRDYKNFNYITFRMELFRQFCLGKMQNKDIHKFYFLVINLPEAHAPMRERCVTVTKQLL